jgi:hypothetical protein
LKAVLREEKIGTAVLDGTAVRLSARAVEYAGVDNEAAFTGGEIDGTAIVSRRIFEDAIRNLDAG